MTLIRRLKETVSISNMCNKKYIRDMPAPVSGAYVSRCLLAVTIDGDRGRCHKHKRTTIIYTPGTSALNRYRSNSILNLKNWSLLLNLKSKRSITFVPAQSNSVYITRRGYRIGPNPIFLHSAYPLGLGCLGSYLLCLGLGEDIYGMCYACFRFGYDVQKN